MLSYMLNRCRHEYVTVTPDGFRFRQQMFDNLNALFKWFKEHFRDPIPGSTPSTPRGGMTSRTPFPATPSLSLASAFLTIHCRFLWLACQNCSLSVEISFICRYRPCYSASCPEHAHPHVAQPVPSGKSDTALFSNSWCIRCCQHAWVP